MRITDYGTLATTQPDDVLPIVDVHDFTQSGTGSTKKITIANLLAGRAAPVLVDYYGADPTGVADSTAAFILAQATGAQVVMGPGTYKLGGPGDISTFGRGQGLTGAGSGLTTISYTGSGAALSIHDPSFSSSLSMAGHFEGFTILGSSAGAGAVGISWGDMNRGRCYDIQISGFSGAGSVGLKFVNTTGWSEQAVWRAIKLNGNTTGALFDTGSFDYSTYEFLLFANSGQDGVVLQNGAVLAGVHLEMRGNFSTGVGNTAAVIAIDRGNGSGTSRLQFSSVDISVESDGSTGSGHFSLVCGGGSSSQFSAQGVLSFRTGNSVAFQGASVATAVQFGFSGRLHDPVLGLMDSGDGLVVRGGSQWTERGSLTTAFPGTVFARWGDVWSFQLANGANTLAITLTTPSQARRIDLFLAQPSSGAAGTMTWPAGTKWPSATAPTLSITNSAVDHLRLVWLPSAAAWYGELVAKDLR